MGAEVVSCTDTLEVGTTSQGFPVFADRHAWESDGIVALNRVKPHSDLSGRIESGMLKIMAIGLGKREGATETHKQIWKFGFEPTIRAVSDVILESGKILLGIAIVENEMHAVADVRAALAKDIVAQEESAIVVARASMARLPFLRLDLLIVDEIGKNISGAGMDTKVVGRALGMPPGEGPTISLIFARDLTAESGGNAVGVGHADIIHERSISENRPAEDFRKRHHRSQSPGCAAAHAHAFGSRRVGPGPWPPGKPRSRRAALRLDPQYAQPEPLRRFPPPAGGDRLPTAMACV